MDLTRTSQTLLTLLASKGPEGMPETELKEAAGLSAVGFDAGMNDLEDRGLIESFHQSGLRYRATDDGRQTHVALQARPR